MQTKNLIITACSIALLASGCKPAKNESRMEDPGTAVTATQAERLRMKKEVREAVQATKDYAYAERAEFVQAMKARLADLERQVDELGTRIETSSSKAKDDAKVKLQALRSKTAELNSELDRVNNSTESTWEQVKAGFKKGLDEASDSFSKARQWLSDQIAP